MSEKIEYLFYVNKEAIKAGKFALRLGKDTVILDFELFSIRFKLRRSDSEIRSIDMISKTESKRKYFIG